MPKFIHICQDEKFINSGYEQFEYLYPDCNLLYVYDCTSQKLKHINIDKKKIRFIELTHDVFNDLPIKSIVIFHSLPNHIINFIGSINSNIPVIWFLFGFETYGDPNIYKRNYLLDKKTYKYFENNTSKVTVKENLYAILAPLIRIFKPNFPKSLLEVKKHAIRLKYNQLKRVDFLGCSFDEEYDFQIKLLKRKIPKFDFWYYPLEQTVEIATPINSNKNTILIGHSGFTNGNHYDILSKIQYYDLIQYKILVPFSYGNVEYMTKIKTLVKDLKLKIDFLESFLPKKEYNIFLNDVKFAIFNNRRQQAVGNTIALLYLGAKVFMSEKNSFYKYLKNNKIVVFSYEKELNEDELKMGLNVMQIEHNRKVLFDLLNSDFQRKSLKDSINFVIKNMEK